jgi:hypothetical protein
MRQDIQETKDAHAKSSTSQQMSGNTLCTLRSKDMDLSRAKGVCSGVAARPPLPPTDSNCAHFLTHLSAESNDPVCSRKPAVLSLISAHPARHSARDSQSCKPLSPPPSPPHAPAGSSAIHTTSATQASVRQRRGSYTLSSSGDAQGVRSGAPSPSASINGGVQGTGDGVGTYSMASNAFSVYDLGGRIAVAAGSEGEVACCRHSSMDGTASSANDNDA